MVYDSAPTTNFGSQDIVIAGSRGAGVYRTYIQFDLEAIPDDAVILGANLELYYYYNIAAAVPTAVGAYVVKGPWNDNSITWNNQPTVSTTPEYVRNVPGSPTNDYVSWNIGDIVADWWDGSKPNYGIMLRETDENAWTAWKHFCASEWGASSQRPQLIIYYYDPEP
jgi:hypothetical protein